MENLKNKIVRGDSIELFQEIPDNSIDVTFADPPFNLKKKYNGYKDSLEFEEYLKWCELWIKEMVRNGTSIGQAFSKYVWLHQRDFTAKNVDMPTYDTALYGSSTMQVTNVQVLYGDPTLTLCSPEWTEPVPVQP